MGIGVSNAPQSVPCSGDRLLRAMLKESRLGAAYQDIAGLPIEFRLCRGYLDGLRSST